MKFCPKCDSHMRRETSSGQVEFQCGVCGERVAGTEWDTRIRGGVLDSGETREKYGRLISNSAHDRVNQQVRRDCEKCGLDYMTQIRVGDREVVVYTCKCGHTEQPR